MGAWQESPGRALCYGIYEHASLAGRFEKGRPLKLLDHPSCAHGEESLLVALHQR